MRRMFAELARKDSNSKMSTIENEACVRAAAFGLQSIIVSRYSKQVSTK